MKRNSAARRLLGMDHWRSNTQLMAYSHWHVAVKTGRSIPNWVAVRTRSYDFSNFDE